MMRHLPILKLPSWAIVLGIAAYLTLVFNTGVLGRIGALVTGTGVRGWLVVGAFACLAFVIQSAILFLLAHPRTLKPVAVFSLLIGAPLAYLVNEYGISVDHRLLATALETDRAEARDLITLKMVLWSLTTGLLPAWLVYRATIAFPDRATRWRQNLQGLSASLVVGFATIVATYGDISSLLREQRQIIGMITPVNGMLAVANYALRASPSVAPITVQAIPIGVRGEAPTAGVAAKPSLTVIVVGETARGDHFSINGYARPTTPRLTAVPDLISFKDATSCATLTAESLPCMFSGLGRAGTTKTTALTRENLLDLIKGAGFDVVWIDNQSGCKGLCTRIETIMTAELKDPRYCTTGECHDEILVDYVGKRADALTRDTVIVLHMMGSHGPAYWKRYPEAFEVFKPACRSSEFSRCTREQIVAAYDNTLHYTDHVLGELLSRLEAADRAGTPTSFVYMSDHGESLGEKGLYLHGVPFLFAPRAQTHIPFVVWLSKTFEQRKRLTSACLATRRHEPVSHDHFFHTVLGLLDIRSAARVDQLNLFQACRSPE